MSTAEETQHKNLKMFTNNKTPKIEFPLLAFSVISRNEDILSEILCRLPIKSICKFKCVSKQWHSLINSPHFCLKASRHCCKKTSHLFAFRQNHTSLLKSYDVFLLEKGLSGNSCFHKFITFVDSYSKMKILYESCSIIERGWEMKIMQSCNGLLCCKTYMTSTKPFLNCGKFNYYICNPTTHQFRKLPNPVHGKFRKTGGVESVLGVYLAFDQRKSRHFKVICVYISKTVIGYFEMEIYSSVTGEWRRKGGPFIAAEVDFSSGVYWNGAINWLSLVSGDGLYFNVDEERFGKLPMLPNPDGQRRRIRYFGESYDHLHLVEHCSISAVKTQFDIYEMEGGYSGWFIRYHVDVKGAVKEFLKPKETKSWGILSVVTGEKDEDPFMVLNFPGMTIRYNLGNKSFEKICDYDESEIAFSRPLFHWKDTFQYIKSICTV